ncbi:MAG: DNA gyrase modulator [Nitrospira sp.]
MSNDKSGALARFGVTDRDIEQALGRVKVSAVNYADLYFEYCQSESVSMEEGIVKRATKSVGQGVGVRATAGEKTGFAYSDELTAKDLNMPPIRHGISRIRFKGRPRFPSPIGRLWLGICILTTAPRLKWPPATV